MLLTVTQCCKVFRLWATHKGCAKNRSTLACVCLKAC